MYRVQDPDAVSGRGNLRPGNRNWAKRKSIEGNTGSLNRQARLPFEASGSLDPPLPIDLTYSGICLTNQVKYRVLLEQQQLGATYLYNKRHHVASEERLQLHLYPIYLST